MNRSAPRRHVRIRSALILVLALGLAVVFTPAAEADPPPGPEHRVSERRAEIFIPQEVSAPAAAEALPAGFQESIVFEGLTEPMAVAFSQDGRVFVGEKSGLIKVFDGLTDPTPSVFADLSTNVYNFFDRGFMSLALAPNFPTDPYVYALYAYDGDIGGPAPKWGTAGVLSDPCPTPPGATTRGCVVSGRLTRMQAIGSTAGPEQVLLNGWCQQYPSHSLGDLAFAPNGALFVTGGDGASFTFADYGQQGLPRNPCGDPPSGVGGQQFPPSAEGGALRSQDIRTLADPTDLDGAILRVTPSTGAPDPGNPLAGNPDTNAARIVAHGLRNPFRVAFRPGTDDLWIGDVGWHDFEEIDVLTNPSGAMENYGWPCYEGTGRQPTWDALDLTLCEQLYPQSGAHTTPVFTYRPDDQPAPGGNCDTGSASLSAMEFYNGGSYPSQYHGALFFGDYSRRCIWVMFPGAGGEPNPANVAQFVAPAQFPVDLEVGPGGDLFYVDIGHGQIRRIQFFSGNQPPTAVAEATPTSGPVPLSVSFDGTGSSDPDPADTVTYAWDLDGDGQFDDSTSPTPSRTYTQAGTVVVQLRVTDPGGATDVDSVTIMPGGSPPTATIDTPTAGTTWRVGDVINFSGHATDPQDGTLPASQLSWSLILHHCPSACHEHPVQDFVATASGQFVAPDHEYPSHLELRLTATDSSGLQHMVSRLLYPQTVSLTFQTSPTGLQIVASGTSAATPFTIPVIVGSTNSISAPTPQTTQSGTWYFASWSDGGAQSHDIVAGSVPATYTATFQLQTTTNVAVSDSGYSPSTVQVPAGTSVRWNFNGPSPNSVTDNSGMNLYDSGVRQPGDSFVFTFVGAGSYAYRSSVNGQLRGTVQVPMTVSPTSGGTSTQFQVVWASGPPPPGFVYNVQVRRPGQQFVDWRAGTTLSQDVFTPDAGIGGYRFRARLRNTTNGRASGFSAMIVISVS